MMNSPRPVSKLIPVLFAILLFLVFYVIGSLFVSVPETAVSGSETVVSEPGLLSPISGLLVIALVNLMIIVPLIQSSRWEAGNWR